MKVKHVGEPHGWKITPQNEGFRWVNPMGGDVYKALVKIMGDCYQRPSPPTCWVIAGGFLGSTSTDSVCRFKVKKVSLWDSKKKKNILATHNYISFLKLTVTPRKFNSSPLKIGNLKRKLIFQSSCFRGELLNFRGVCTWKIMLVNNSFLFKGPWKSWGPQGQASGM